MIDLSPLVARAGPRSLPYFDPSFPDRMLILHAARPRDWSPDDPVLFVHHGVARNGRDYRDYWLPHVDAGGMLVIAIEFPEASFPEYLWYNFGNLHTADGTTQSARRNGPSASTRGCSRRCATRASPPLGDTACSAIRPAANMSIACCRSATAITSPSRSAPTPAPMRCLTWQSIGPGALERTEVTPDDLENVLGFPAHHHGRNRGHQDHRPVLSRRGRNRCDKVRLAMPAPTRYLRTGQEAAAELGVSLAWRVIDVPDVGHDGRRMSDAAAPLIAEAFCAGAAGSDPTSPLIRPGNPPPWSLTCAAHNQVGCMIG